MMFDHPLQQVNYCLLEGTWAITEDDLYKMMSYIRQASVLTKEQAPRSQPA
jgi:hypothetical protein